MTDIEAMERNITDTNTYTNTDTETDNETETSEADLFVPSRLCPGITKRGVSCKNFSSSGFCRWHQPSNVSNVGKCAGVLRNGEQCRLKAKYGLYCGHHKQTTASPQGRSLASVIAQQQPNNGPNNEGVFRDRIKPPFPYQGSKTRLLKQILPMFPRTFGKYFEPFVGGGAVCFSQLPSNARISDLDPVVVGVYQDIKNNYDEFKFYLDFYGGVFIDLDNDELSSFVIELLNSNTDRVVKSVLYVLMSRCVYKSLVKRNGTTFQRQKFYNRMTERKLSNLHSNFDRMHDYLQSVGIECNSFKNVLEEAREGDFVYLDPPYYYEVGDGHVSYNNANTSTERLMIYPIRDTLDELSRRRVKVAMSMSDYQCVRELFADYTIREIEIRRNMRAGTVVVKELFITNY